MPFSQIKGINTEVNGVFKNVMYLLGFRIERVKQNSIIETSLFICPFFTRLYLMNYYSKAVENSQTMYLCCCYDKKY